MKIPNVRDIETELTFLSTGVGGRSTPVSTGYRVQFHYGGRDCDTVQEFPDDDQVFPGATVRAYCQFLDWKHQVGLIVPGTAFQLREGYTTVAHGKVLRVLALNDPQRGEMC